ncbi:MAG: hypothetical protein M3N46_14055 [Actinomycetota bacterium]|nr:hypothetical protein [Actinomycetota bacterium]
MSADNPMHEPEDRAGAAEVHLDADRTRDELDEIERRLSPSVLVASLKRELTAHLGITAAIGSVLLGVTIGAALRRARRH